MSYSSDSLLQRTMIDMTNPQTQIELQELLATAYARVQKIEEDARAERLQLERALTLARGTRDVTAEARRLTPVMPAGELAERVEIILRGPTAPISLVALAKTLNEPAERVRRELRKLSAAKCATRSADAPDARKIYNHGTNDAPIWQWVIGDETSAQELYAEVDRMISRRPYTHDELLAATGARRGRLSGATVKHQRTGEAIWNVGGSPRQYRWYLGDPKQLPREERLKAEPAWFPPSSSSRR